jgi:hypothetical protein
LSVGIRAALERLMQRKPVAPDPPSAAPTPPTLVTEDERLAIAAACKRALTEVRLHLLSEIGTGQHAPSTETLDTIALRACTPILAALGAVPEDAQWHAGFTTAYTLLQGAARAHVAALRELGLLDGS